MNGPLLESPWNCYIEPTGSISHSSFLNFTIFILIYSSSHLLLTFIPLIVMSGDWSFYKLYVGWQDCSSSPDLWSAEHRGHLNLLTYLFFFLISNFWIIIIVGSISHLTLGVLKEPFLLVIFGATTRQFFKAKILKFHPLHG